jgi:uncharacterized protein
VGLASIGRARAVITGASSGIGFELARELGERGFDLLIAAEDAGVKQAAEELHAHGFAVEAVQTDLATYQGVETLWRAIEAGGRPVQILALNAGVCVRGDFARTTELDDELNLLRLNVLSSVHLAKRVVPAMVKRRSGGVLITSSVAATMPSPLLATYGASKAFLLSFAEALRNELKGTGVGVTALMPGPTSTHFFERAGMEDTKVGQAKKADPRHVARQGVDALLAGKPKVVAGSPGNKVQAFLTRFIPDSAKAGLHRRQAEPAPSHR